MSKLNASLTLYLPLSQYRMLERWAEARGGHLHTMAKALLLQEARTDLWETRKHAKEALEHAKQVAKSNRKREARRAHIEHLRKLIQK
jgi:DNA-directed RNA polymerase subunit F